MQVSALAVLLSLTACAAVIDARSMIIPDPLNLIMFVAGLFFASALDVPGLQSGLLASVCGAGILYGVKVGFKAYRGKDGLGLGDVKFTGAAGPWIGLEGIPLVLLIACGTALLYIAQRQASDPTFDTRQAVPFGPFLAAGISLVSVVQILGNASWVDLIAQALS
jgi:leader peptidase (prepilin peptidase) / N-methyltransferase